MYGGSSKLGRGAGGSAGAGRGAGAKRMSSMLPPSQQQRRLSLGSSNPRGAGRGAAAVAAAAPPAVEESFSLVSGRNPLAFAMIIRLAPDLTDEIKRLESSGGTARIKFDSLANNPTGNVIDVGGKEFKFTSSRETGDLCDIYEQRQSGEDGKGLLVESGCAWRKLNVQRILDESTKNHVKKLSEDAKRERDQRRAIVLEPGNPSMKSQIKQLAAVETNPWKHFKQKKEPPPKKRKTEPSQVIGPPKIAFKSGMSSTANVKARHSPSPITSPPEQSVPAPSPLRALSAQKNHSSAEDAILNEVIGKDKAAVGSDREIPPRNTSVAREVIGRKNNVGSKPIDLQSTLINLLRENPKGMSIKALEKAVGDSISNSVRKIDPILKRIATFQAPGRYILKSEAESEGVKKPSSESGSSPEENIRQTPAAEENRDHLRALESDFKESNPLQKFEEKELLNTKLGDNPNAFKEVDIQQNSPEPLGERKASENSEGRVGSSSDSGSDSDSDSDSSDSGSDSGSPSRSRSKSPVGSGSGSSSDSDSDASSNKEGSDVDVDIMSDDDKVPKQKLLPDPPSSRSPVIWRSPNDRPVQVGNDGMQDYHESDVVEIEKDVSDGKPQIKTGMAAISFPSGEHRKSSAKPISSPNHDELQERQNFIGSLFDEGDNTVKGGSRIEQTGSSERILKGKHKRALEGKHSGIKSDKSKKSKTEVARQFPSSGSRQAHLQESSTRLPSDRLDGPYAAPIVQTTNGSDREGTGDFSIPKGNNQVLSGKSSADFQQLGKRLFEQDAPPKAPDLMERPDNHADSMGQGRKYSEKNSRVHESFPLKKCISHKDAPFEDGYAIEIKAPRNSKEGSVKGKQLTPSDSHYQKPGVIGKVKDGGQVSGSFTGPTGKENSKTAVDKSPAINGRPSRLQREYSDLELGELREPLPEELPSKKQVERKGSFKQSENKPDPSDNWKSDTSKGKPVGKANLDFGKFPGLDLNSKEPINLEGSSKKRNNEDCGDDLIRSQHRVSQHHLIVVDNSETGPPQSNKWAEFNGNSRQTEASAKPGIDFEGYGESNKKVPTLQHDKRREVVSNSARERKRGTSKTLAELPNGRNESLLAEGNNSERKRRESSTDENSCSYSKYEKDEPDLKGPIQDFSQYKEYVQEYRDKYDSYLSLNKILESYRIEFQKLGKDLELAKGRDSESYYNILEQLKESYSHCGARHKRLKKIFVVLHEELKNLKQRIKDFAVAYAKD